MRAIRESVGIDARSIAEIKVAGSRRKPKNIRIYDTQVPFDYLQGAYPIPTLLSQCDWIDMQTSLYRPSLPWGVILGPTTTNQTLERLTFPDESFDVVVTTDVMEHVRLDDRAHEEIRRVLKPGGVYVFTVPHVRDRRETLVRVAVRDPMDPQKDEFLLEPEYHGDANDEENRALSYRVYGTDLDERLQHLGFTVDYEKRDCLDIAVLNTELFYCRLLK